MDENMITRRDIEQAKLDIISELSARIEALVEKGREEENHQTVGNDGDATGNNHHRNQESRNIKPDTMPHLLRLYSKQQRTEEGNE